MFRLWPLNLNVWTRLPALIALVTAKASTEVSTITTFIPLIPPRAAQGRPCAAHRLLGGREAATRIVLEIITVDPLFTWLDQSLALKREGPVPITGFGARLEAALEERRRWLAQQGLAERSASGEWVPKADLRRNLERRERARIRADHVARAQSSSSSIRTRVTRCRPACARDCDSEPEARTDPPR
jgi:hypothetical protein